MECWINQKQLKLGLSGPSSAFEKWSGHVEPTGSRVGCLGMDGWSSVLRPRQHSIGYMGDGEGGV